MARAYVPDTGVLIQAMRESDLWPSMRETLAGGGLWLSSVVVAEFYAGTRSREDTLLLASLVAAAERVDRLLTPTGGDWARAGQLIARHVRVHGTVEPRDHLADVLIIVSAARLGGRVVTPNMRHMARWAQLATAAGLDVIVQPFVITE